MNSQIKMGLFKKPSSPPPKGEINRILLIQPSRIGDIIFSLPTLSALRRTFPRAWIAWLVDDRCQDLVEGHPDLDEVLVVPFKAIEEALKKRAWKGVGQTFSRLKRDLRSRSFDLSIDLHGLAKSALLVWMAGARFRIGSANTTGMKELSGFFSREIPPRPNDRHTVERNLSVIAFLEGPIEEAQFHLTISKAAQSQVREILLSAGRREQERLVVIHPGAGWLSRRWPADRFAELINTLGSTPGLRLAVIGGAAGGSQEGRLFEQLFPLIRVPVINLVNRLSLKQLIALLQETDLFVGNEAGPMHLAAALDRPLVAIIGPTRPELTGPFGSKARIVRKPVSCSPCRKRNCSEITCMKVIEVTDVLEAVRSVQGFH
jgi:lipopolysaccharide heptosyltransferase I